MPLFSFFFFPTRGDLDDRQSYSTPRGTGAAGCDKDVHEGELGGLEGEERHYRGEAGWFLCVTTGVCYGLSPRERTHPS